jgi:hypothetical protein
MPAAFRRAGREHPVVHGASCVRPPLCDPSPPQSASGPSARSRRSDSSPAGRGRKSSAQRNGWEGAADDTHRGPSSSREPGLAFAPRRRGVPIKLARWLSASCCPVTDRFEYLGLRTGPWLGALLARRPVLSLDLDDGPGNTREIRPSRSSAGARWPRAAPGLPR